MTARVVHGTIKLTGGKNDNAYPAVRWADGTVTHGGVCGFPSVTATARQADSFYPNPSPISGFCGHEAHDRCRGLVRQTRPGGWPSVVFCGCEHCSHIRFVCADCGQRYPIQLTPEPDLDAIDPRTGTCVDRAACVEMIRTSYSNPLREMLAEARAAGRIARASNPRRRDDMPRRSSTDDAATAQDTNSKPARVPKPKTGRCEHCGTATRGGRFAAGHDAKLKGELATVYLDRQADHNARVHALAEAVARRWLRYEAGEDHPALTRGLKTDETDARAATLREWEQVLAGAKKVVQDEGAETVVQRRTADRIPNAA